MKHVDPAVAPVQTAPPVDRQSSGRVPPVREWPECWPVSEQRALAEWDPTCGLRGSIAEEAPLLCAPLVETVAFVSALRTTRVPRLHRAVRAVLGAVQQTGTPYWEWTDAAWASAIDSDPPASLRTASLAYVLCGFSDLQRLDARVWPANLAKAAFGRAFDRSLARVLDTLVGLGYTSSSLRGRASPTLAAVVLETRSAHLEEIDEACLWRVYERYGVERKHVCQLSQALCALGVLQDPIRMRTYTLYDAKDSGRVPPEWAALCQRWRATSTLAPQTRETTYSFALRVGVWLAAIHPGIRQPGDWTVDTCVDFLAAVRDLAVGEWSLGEPDGGGRPMRPNSKRALLYAVRRFFRDVEGWGWERLRFNPAYHLATPKSILQLAGPNPRDVDEAVWIRLVWASLHLGPGDLISQTWYPIEMLRAMAVVWTHAGLRQNEIQRLRVGCAQPQTEPLVDDESGQAVPPGTLCYLRVPASLKSGGQVKPVQAAVLEAVRAWEAVRPEQPLVTDPKTGERVRYLFQYRGRRTGGSLLGRTVIPMLCHKAGVPEEDSRGRITSHRARASAATMLINAVDGLSLPQLMEWLNPVSYTHLTLLTIYSV